MHTQKEIIPYIVKWEGGKRKGNPVLFLPLSSVNKGRITAYAHVGQHSEACTLYYKALRNPTLEQASEVAKLVREYAGLLDETEQLKQVKRDTFDFKCLRESWVRSVPREDVKELSERIQRKLRNN